MAEIDTRRENMGRKVTRVAFGAPEIPKKKNVAAYCRVSSGKDAMLHSLAAQVSYYSELIQSHGEWEYAEMCIRDRYEAVSSMELVIINILLRPIVTSTIYYII